MDPLRILLKAFPPDFSTILSRTEGNVYYALTLKDQRIGICATLGHPVSPPVNNLDETDLNKQAHRIQLIAYYNAIFNSEVEPDAYEDIFTHVDFRTLGQIAMIGYFRPLVSKFDKIGIPVSIFDLQGGDERLTPYTQLESVLSKADCVIITSTTLVNGTFEHIMNLAGQNSRVFMLGPTTIMHPVLFEYPQIQAIYGMSITPGDQRVPEVIGRHGGTPDFSKFTRKICLRRK